MLQFELPNFHGEPGGNTKKWLAQVKFAWEPMKATYGDSDEAKCTFMELQLKGKAARWASKLDESTTSDFGLFSKGLLHSGTTSTGPITQRTLWSPLW